MKKVLKGIGILFLVVIALVLCGVAFLFIRFPRIEPASAAAIQSSPEKLKRGEYLVNHVSSCIHCHSTADHNGYAFPVVAGTEGQGQVLAEDPKLGIVAAPNITPEGLRGWTDGEIIRAMTSGVNKNNQPLFPMMPYLEFSHMTQEDAESIVLYLKTLKRLPEKVAPTKLKFPLNLIVRTIPEPVHLAATASNKGEYLTAIAGCRFCHTPIDDHDQPVESMKFAGGHPFDLPGGKVVRTANLTPDPETGIGNWTKEHFIAKFRRFDSPDTNHIRVEDGQNTVMPWLVFAGMTEEDLGAIFDYLKSQPAQHNKVDKY